MIKEKTILRKQVCLAISDNDFETARNIMSTLCNDEVFTRRNWNDNETEYLMNHVEAIGYEKAIKRVAKKLDRTRLSASKKYHSEIKRLKEKAEKGVKTCQ